MPVETPVGEPTVLYHADGKVGIVTLNRPEKLNALTMEMRLAIRERIEEADGDPDTSVIILKAAGRSFCVGFDVGGSGQHPSPWRNDALKYHDRLSTSTNALMSPWNAAKPVIASVQGHALGGGCQLAMFADITIAADDAQFGEPEILFSQVGPAVVMPWLIGHKRARELIYFGDKIDAETALELRMINRIVPREQLEAATLQYARRMTKIAPEALKAGKRAINRGIEAQGFRDAIRSGIDVLAPLYAATTDASRQFDEIRKEEGLKAALKWRHADLAEDESGQS